MTITIILTAAQCREVASTKAVSLTEQQARSVRGKLTASAERQRRAEPCPCKCGLSLAVALKRHPARLREAQTQVMP